MWGKTGSKLYGAKSGADYVDNPKRFRVFSEACIEAVRTLPFGPGEDCVFVANDWHSAMLPVLLKVLSPPLWLHCSVVVYLSPSSPPVARGRPPIPQLA